MWGKWTKYWNSISMKTALEFLRWVACTSGLKHIDDCHILCSAFWHVLCLETYCTWRSHVPPLMFSLIVSHLPPGRSRLFTFHVHSTLDQLQSLHRFHHVSQPWHGNSCMIFKKQIWCSMNRSVFVPLFSPHGSSFLNIRIKLIHFMFK